MAVESPREMELLAQVKAAEKEKGQPKSGTSGFTPDSGVSDVGQKRSWTQKEIEDMPLDKYRRHKSDIEEALREGRVK